MLVDLDGQHAHHVVMKPHQALHFLHGGRGGIRLQEGIVALAVLVDLVGHRLDAPVFAVDDLAAVVREDRGEMFDEAFGLRVGQVLTRDEDMLVERHAGSNLSGAFHRSGQSFRGPSTSLRRFA